MTDRSSLEETIALLEATLESTHDGVLVVDLNRRIIRYNRQYLNMFGLTAEQLDASGLDEIAAMLQGQLEDGGALLDVSAERGGDAPTEVFATIRFKDGRVFERYAAPHRIGATVVGLVISYRDISQAARAEQALSHHRALLEKAQEVAHVGSWVAELDGTDHLAWSNETHRIFGVPFGSFPGTSQAFFSFVHPEDRELVKVASDAAKAGGGPYDVEHRIVLADRSVRWVHERADPIRDGDGRMVRLIGTVQDITERRQLEEQLRQSQKMDAIGRLAGGIAHDLNNALTAIGGYAELALDEMASDHAARTDVEEVRRAAERAAAVTRQLLAFSRKQLLEPRVLHVNDAVADLARMLGRLLGTTIELRTRLGDVPAIVADPGQFEQAVINLAVNARDAMPEGGALTLATSFEEVDDAFAIANRPIPPGHYVVVSVGDTGHGMAAATKARIFEPFFTTKEVGKGTGLGLSMVYGTVKQSGGFIFVESHLERGTTFRMFFPPAPAAGSSHETRARAAVGAPRPATATVLIVEDESAVRHLVASTLKTEPYRLLLAASAEDALTIAAAHEGHIDLLLTDAMMPGKSGIELANALVAARPGLPVIIMSGYTEEALDIAGLTHEVALVHKPFTPRELRERVRAVLAR